jgi:hypothetical protein
MVSSSPSRAGGAEDAVSAPAAGAGEAIGARSVEPEVAFEAADPSFGSGAPSHHPFERSPILDLPARRVRFALGRQHDMADPRRSQRVFHGGFAVAAIGGHRSRRPPGAAFDARNAGFEHRRVGRVALFDVVIEDDTVFVVNDLRLVAELHRLTQPSFGDRPRIGVVQRHDPRRPLRRRPGEAVVVALRRFALIERARARTVRVLSANLVRVASPMAFSFFAVLTNFATPLANSPESDGYATFASTTVVSARARLVFNTFASAALANSASFNSSTAA